MEMTSDDYDQNIKALQADVIQLLDEHFDSVPPEILAHEVTAIIARYFAQVLTLKESENGDWTTKETSQEVQSWIQGATAHALFSYQIDGVLQPILQPALFTSEKLEDPQRPNYLDPRVRYTKDSRVLLVIDGKKE